MDLQSKIGAKIKSLRENNELSQSQLAELVGYKDKTSIAKIEAGKVDLHQSKILAFSKALNVTPSFLLNLDSDKPESDQLIDNPAFFNRMLKYLELLNSKGKEEASKRIEELTYIPEYAADDNMLNAAHELPNSSKKEQKHDNDIMDNDDEIRRRDKAHSK